MRFRDAMGSRAAAVVMYMLCSSTMLVSNKVVSAAVHHCRVFMSFLNQHTVTTRVICLHMNNFNYVCIVLLSESSVRLVVCEFCVCMHFKSVWSASFCVHAFICSALPNTRKRWTDVCRLHVPGKFGSNSHACA